MNLLELSWILVTAALARAGDDEPIPPSPFDQEIVLELSADDPRLVEGRGPAQIVEYVAEFEGTLHVWTSSELDLFLRVEDTSTMELLGEDDDSGGGTTPYLHLEVSGGDRFAVLVASSTEAAPLADAGGSLVLHFVAAPESATTREAAAAVRKLEDEARSLQDGGDPEGARALVKAAVLEGIKGSETSQVLAEALWDLGFTAYATGELAVCVEAWSRARRHYERTQPEEHPDLIRTRANLSSSMLAIGDLAGARVLQEAVLAARERTLPEDHPDLLRARANLAVSMSQMGELAGARALREAVLAGYERTLPEDHPDLLAARTNLAASRHAMGDLGGARALLEAVLAGSERTLPADHPDLLRARANLAASIHAMGDLAGARALTEAVLAGYERTLPEGHPELIAARAQLAAVMSEMGDLVGARALEEAVLAARERALPADHPDLLRARTNLAVSLQQTGDFVGARALREAVLATRERTLPEGHPDLHTARANLASSMRQTGDLAGARALQEAVLAAHERTLPADHPDLLRARTNLAVSMSDMGDLAGARALREAVVEARERTLPEDHPELLRARANLAGSLSDMGDLAGARALLPSLCAGMRARILASLTLSPREARQTVAAEGRRLAEICFWSRTAGSELLARVFELTETMRLVAGEAARSLARFDSDPELAPILAEAAAVRRAQGDLIASAGRDEHDAESVAAELTRLSFERDRLAREASRRLAERGVVTRAVDVQALSKALEEGDAAVGYRRLPHGYVDEATGEVGIGSDHVLAHVLSASGALVRVDLGPAEELEELTTAWRTALDAPLLRGVAVVEEGGDPEVNAGLRLRERLLDPVLEAAGEDVRRLFVCADDLVFLVPLEALPEDDEGAERVGDRVRIVSEVSFARLLTKATPVESAPSLLAFGGVDYDAAGAAPKGLFPAAPPVDDIEETDGRRGARSKDESSVEASATRGTRSAMPERFRGLRHTRYEAEGTGELFEEAFELEPTVRTQGETTKAALFEAAAGKRFVHLATHGWFAPDSIKSTEDAQPGSRGSNGFATMSAEERVTGFAPMTLCGLALAGANRGRDSLGRVPGILTAEELCSLDLSQCELAVLSACETNVGIRRAGQGIQSLQAALYAAGARTSITSLWKVDDRATRTLMEIFYSNLWLEGMPKAEALWAAKQALRDEGHEPRDWAGWILTGDPR